MRHAMSETVRRREIQEAFNREHQITPEGIRKAIRDITDHVGDQMKKVAESQATYETRSHLAKDDLARVIKGLESLMKESARKLEFERAALLRDEVVELKRLLVAQEAVERGAELIDWYRRQQSLRDVKVWQEQDSSKVPDDYQWHYQRSTAADSPKRDDVSSKEQIEAGRYCIGDPDDCLRYLEQYVAAGVDEIMPLFQVGPITHQEVMTTLRLFGKYIVPHFKDLERKAQAASSKTGNAG